MRKNRGILWSILLKLLLVCFLVVLFGSSCVSFGLETFDPLMENQLSPQPDDEVIVTEEFGITVGDLRRALNVEDQYQILLKKQEADVSFVEEFVDDVNQRLMIDGVVIGVLSGALLYFIFN